MDSAQRVRQEALFRGAGLFAVAGLVVLGTGVSIFSLAAFLAVAAQIVFGDEEYTWQMIFFLNPFSTIFKLSASSSSLFTYLLLLFAVMLFQQQRTLPPLWPFFAIYMIAIPALTLQPWAFNILKWIKLLCGILMVYYFFESSVCRNPYGVFMAFVLGILGSSVVRYLNFSFLRIERYVELNVVGDAGRDNRELIRFAGLYGDPNYYVVNVIIALCLLIIMLYKNKISIPLFALLVAPLCYFAVSTYSKSAVLMLGLPLLVFLRTVRISNRRELRIATVVIAAIAAIFLSVKGGGIFDVILSRVDMSDGDLNKLTTGRMNIWMYNLEFFRDNPLWFLFGKGISAGLINGRAHHNVYLETLYHLGLFGTCLLCGIFSQICRSVPHRGRRNIMNYSTLVTILMMYFFLSELFYYDLSFHLTITFAVMNMDLS